MSRPTILVQGTLDMLVLKMLRLEPMNGWMISQRLKQLSNDVLSVSDGSLYPTLNKLENGGWIRAEWQRSENSQTISAAGGFGGGRGGEAAVRPARSRSDHAGLERSGGDRPSLVPGQGIADPPMDGGNDRCGR